MSAASYTQGYKQTAPNGGCATCHHFGGWAASVMRGNIKYVAIGSNSRCLKEPRVIAIPAQGCHDWEREVGADDEPHKYSAYGQE